MPPILCLQNVAAKVDIKRNSNNIVTYINMHIISYMSILNVMYLSLCLQDLMLTAIIANITKIISITTAMDTSIAINPV